MSGTPILIRQATRRDLLSLEWEGAYIRFRRMYAQVYQRSRENKARMWLAEVVGKGVVGQVFVQLSSSQQELANGYSRAYIHGFRVRPEYRQQGIGSQLMKAVEDDLIGRGYQEVCLNVVRDNRAARQFYEQCGYKVIKKDPGKWFFYDHQGNRQEVHEPGWRMLKKLKTE